MAIAHIPAFSHRPNPDGTTDSICKKCFLTVVNARWEADLDRAEQNHSCDPKELEYWKELGSKDREVPLPIHRESPPPRRAH